MGWEEPMVGLDCVDDQPVDRYRAVQQIAHEELFQRLGWFHIRVRREHTRKSIVFRVRTALRQRGAR